MKESGAGSFTISGHPSYNLGNVIPADVVRSFSCLYTVYSLEHLVALHLLCTFDACDRIIVKLQHRSNVLCIINKGLPQGGEQTA